MDSFGGILLLNINNTLGLITMMIGNRPLLFRNIITIQTILFTIWSLYFIPSDQLLSALLWTLLFGVINIVLKIRLLISKKKKENNMHV